MAAHTHSPQIREQGLADDCPRCAEHAEQLFTLDDDNLRALIERTRRWMRDEDFPRSETELIAMRRVEQHLWFMRTAARLGIEAPS